MSQVTFNRFCGIGHLAGEPKLKSISGGAQNVCEMRVAFARLPDREGAQRPADFLAVEVWGAQGRACEKHLAKGRRVLVEGEVRQNSWKDEKENWHERIVISAHRITFLSPKPESATAPDAEIAPEVEIAPEAVTPELAVTPEAGAEVEVTSELGVTPEAGMPHEEAEGVVDIPF